jgi:FkbH-like protein
MEYSESFVPALARAQAGYVKAVKGRGRKCIVVDLDDTLWGGIVGEDGIDGIHLGETPPGNIFADFQRLLRDFHDRGILLAINSKNNPEDALEVIRDHPAMVLREEHFTAMRINWQDKVTNLREIAAELNLGLDSFVFVDDNPAERLHVEQALPEVLTVDLPRDSAAYRRCLEQLNDFTVVQLTPEDMSRTSMYRAERQRRSLHESSASLDEFLASLRMEVSIEPLAPRTVRRAAQLVQRTNQFNLTTRRYSDEDLRRLGENGRFHIWTMAVRDVFGDNGIVGLAIVEAGEEHWRIDTFLMSCRVLGRRLEDELLGIVANGARTAGAAQLLGTYRPTKKNGQVQDFYRQRGFRLAADQRISEGDTDEAETWVLDLPLEPAVRIANRHAPQ